MEGGRSAGCVSLTPSLSLTHALLAHTCRWSGRLAAAAAAAVKSWGQRTSEQQAASDRDDTTD